MRYCSRELNKIPANAQESSLLLASKLKIGLRILYRGIRAGPILEGKMTGNFLLKQLTIDIKLWF
jgi:hypothetical protein